jgi:hypothetical protein
MRFAHPLALSVFATLLSACAGNVSNVTVAECQENLAGAYEDLKFARAVGGQDRVEYAAAVTLIAEAKSQIEHGEYQNCVDTIQRAREYINLSAKPL